jgi:hypothetical protein
MVLSRAAWKVAATDVLMAALMADQMDAQMALWMGVQTAVQKGG